MDAQEITEILAEWALNNLRTHRMPQNKPQAVYNSEHGGSHMDVEPLDPRQGPVIDLTKPRTFTDKNLDPRDEPGDSSQKITSQPAKPGGSISPELNAPKQFSRGSGSTKPNPEGVTKI